MMDKYEDMLYMPNHKSTKHPQMSMIDRAAQFSPFAALTGHNAAIKETARLTDKKIEIDESTKELIRERLQIIVTNLKENGRSDDVSTYSITYFQPDSRKTGGSYITATGKVKKIDEYKRWVIMRSGEVIPMDDITMIDGKLFEYVDN